MTRSNSDTNPFNTMDSGNANHIVCICGRSFSQRSAYSHHQRNCQKSKKWLAGALAAAKEIWSQRKKPRIADEAASTIPNGGLLGLKNSNSVDIEQVRCQKSDIFEQEKTHVND
jgi:hypothetical protein